VQHHVQQAFAGRGPEGEYQGAQRRNDSARASRGTNLPAFPASDGQITQPITEQPGPPAGGPGRDIRTGP
jgi:hypothetical protein